MRAIDAIKRLYATTNKDRPLLQSILVPELAKALRDWIENAPHDAGTLIGGLAASYYALPRTTMDIDLIFAGSVPSLVPGFKKIRAHAFEHKETGVEVEVLDAAFLGIPEALVQKVTDTAHKSDGVSVASPEGLIALKLQRASRQDQADIESLLKRYPITLNELQHWNLTAQQIAIFHEIKYSLRN